MTNLYELRQMAHGSLYIKAVDVNDLFPGSKLISLHETHKAACDAMSEKLYQDAGSDRLSKDLNRGLLKDLIAISQAHKVTP